MRIHALTRQTPEPDVWVKAIEQLAAQPVDLKKDWENHCRWWQGFWSRGWIITSDRTVPAEQRERFHGEVGPVGNARGGRRRRDGGTKLQHVPVLHGGPGTRPAAGEIQRRAVHAAVSPERSLPQAIWPGRIQEAISLCGPTGRRLLAQRRGLPGMGPPFHRPERAAAVLAFVDEWRLRLDESRSSTITGMSWRCARRSP